VQSCIGVEFDSTSSVSEFQLTELWLLELIWREYSIANRLGTLDDRVQITLEGVPETDPSGLVNPEDILSRWCRSEPLSSASAGPLYLSSTCCVIYRLKLQPITGLQDILYSLAIHGNAARTSRSFVEFEPPLSLWSCWWGGMGDVGTSCPVP
jgi:hypothetical protein